MVRTALLCTTAALAFGNPALALDFGPGMTLQGKVELEYVDFGSSDDLLVNADIGLSWRSAPSGSFGFGADFAIDVLHDLNNDIDDFSTVWGALVIGTTFGEFSIGAPEPVLETVLDFPKFTTSKAIQAETSFLTVSPAVTAAKINDEIPAGLAYRNTTGDLSYGVSLHRFDAGPAKADDIQFAIRYQRGNSTFMGGAEHIDLPSGVTQTAYKIGVLYQADRLELGAQVGRAKVLSSEASYGQLHAAYDVTDALTLGAGVMMLDTTTTDTLLNLNGEFKFGKGGFVEGGVTHDDGGDNIWDVGVGLRF